MNRIRIIIFALSFPLLLFSICTIYAQQNQPNVNSDDAEYNSF